MKKFSNLKKKKFLVSSIVAIFIIGSLSSIVYAAKATSIALAYGPVLNYSYGSVAEVFDSGIPNTTTRYVVASTEVQVSGNQSVPTGYMGVYARLFKESTLCATIYDWSYNSVTAAGTTGYANGDCGSGNYKSYGRTAAYNGNGYTIYDTKVSPFISFSSSKNSTTISKQDEGVTEIPKYKTNENGETYGSALGVPFGLEPDLIEAYGVDGTIGYVRSKDLNPPMPKTPQEAVSKQLRRSTSDVVLPMYDVSGQKVIGEFHATSGEIEIKTSK